MKVTPDDRVIMACYSDGAPHAIVRARAALPHRSPKGVAVRAVLLRKRGLIRGKGGSLRNSQAFSDAPLNTQMAELATPKPTNLEKPMRCPHCERPFFLSDYEPTGPNF